MFENTKAFSGFSVDDVAKAREFYGGTLGLAVEEDNGMLAIARGVSFERYPQFDQDEKGVMRGDEGPPIAGVLDPAGNVLAVLEAEASGS